MRARPAPIESRSAISLARDGARLVSSPATLTQATIKMTAPRTPNNPVAGTRKSVSRVRLSSSVRTCI
jgi:hypothetical protein